MNKSAVMMPSVTHAMKAKRLLASQGFACEIKRASGRLQKGCTHFILVNTDVETLVALLKKNNIRYGEILPKAVGL